MRYVSYVMYCLTDYALHVLTCFHVLLKVVFVSRGFVLFCPAFQ